jgi:hypothetical protein
VGDIGDGRWFATSDTSNTNGAIYGNLAYYNQALTALSFHRASTLRRTRRRLGLGRAHDLRRAQGTGVPTSWASVTSGASSQLSLSRAGFGRLCRRLLLIFAREKKRHCSDGLVGGQAGKSPEVARPLLQLFAAHPPLFHEAAVG